MLRQNVALLKLKAVGTESKTAMKIRKETHKKNVSLKMGNRKLK